MMVYVAKVTFEGYDFAGDHFECDDVIGVFRTEKGAEKALKREYELLELQGAHGHGDDHIPQIRRGIRAQALILFGAAASSKYTKKSGLICAKNFSKTY